jgi:hypothetical protein
MTGYQMLHTLVDAHTLLQNASSELPHAPIRAGHLIDQADARLTAICAALVQALAELDAEADAAARRTA